MDINPWLSPWEDINCKGGSLARQRFKECDNQLSNPSPEIKINHCKTVYMEKHLCDAVHEDKNIMMKLQGECTFSKFTGEFCIFFLKGACYCLEAVVDSKTNLREKK